MEIANFFSSHDLLKNIQGQDLYLIVTVELLLILGQVLFMIALLHMVSQRRTPTSMSAWLLAIFLLPHVAVPLYFLIGTRKRRNRYKKSDLSLHVVHDRPPDSSNLIEGVLCNNGIPPASDDNKVELYFNGVQAYQELLRQINNATISIKLSTYVLVKDEVTKNILAALEKKAQQGVSVQILIDSLGSYSLYFSQAALKPLRKAGGEVLFFMPLLRMPFRNYINLRNHRKIYLFDDKAVLSGGMNLSNDYMGPLEDEQRWQDILFLAEGSAVLHYCNIFSADWAYATGMKVDVHEPMSRHLGNTLLQVVPSGPDIRNDALYEALLSAIYAAKQRIWIVTPYFIPDITIMTALIIAQHQGVDVKLITPRRSNHFVADFGRSSYMRTLEENSVSLALYEGNMLHAKAILFDETSTMLGSVNMDNRSLFLNYEVVSFAYSPEIISQVEAWMTGLLENSTHTMKPAGKVRRIGENIMRVVAPLL